MSRPKGHVTITFMSGPLDGKVLMWDYPQGSDPFILSIGRNESADVLLNYDSQVSRLHAQITFGLPDLFYLEDIGSRNGTFIKSERIEGKTPLIPGELFRIGRTWLRLDILRSAFEPDMLDDSPF